MSNITDFKLVELVDKIKKKELSSAEVTTAFIERSKKSKKLNAYITENYENAIKKAKIFDQKPDFKKKLPGIPIACLLYTSPSPRDAESSRMPSSA